MTIRGVGVALLVIFFLVRCDLLEYSPNQVYDQDTPVNLNQKNLDKLFATPGDDTITIAFVGDSQRFYEELESFIDTANAISSIDFVLMAGDISDFGLLEEFEQIEDILSTLNKPFISVVGNHDVQAKGEETFERMFGPLNFSFIYNKVKFIAHNTNGREYAPGTIPDMAWLRKEFSKDDGAQYYVPVSHIPPFDDDFDKDLEADYTQLLREKKPIISLHGHIHEFKDGFPYEDGVRYMTSHSFELQSFVLLKIVKGKIYHEIISY